MGGAGANLVGFDGALFQSDFINLIAQRDVPCRLGGFVETG